jgi:hypothetical protein
MFNVFASKTFVVSEIFLGGTLGAAGWILGASEELASAGSSTDANIVRLCAGGVFLVGGVMWLLWLTGRRLNVLLVVEILLGASFIFGTAALGIMQSRGVLALAVDSSGKYPEWLAYSAPVAILAIMAIILIPPIRRSLRRTTP